MSIIWKNYISLVADQAIMIFCIIINLIYERDVWRMLYDLGIYVPDIAFIICLHCFIKRKFFLKRKSSYHQVLLTTKTNLRYHSHNICIQYLFLFFLLYLWRLKEK